MEKLENGINSVHIEKAKK